MDRMSAMVRFCMLRFLTRVTSGITTRTRNIRRARQNPILRIVGFKCHSSTSGTRANRKGSDSYRNRSCPNGVIETMNPITHLLIGWCTACVHPGLDDRERTLVTLAAVVPDIDGLG